MSRYVGETVPCPGCGGACVEISQRPSKNGLALVERYVKLCSLCKGDGRCLVEPEYSPEPSGSANPLAGMSEAFR